MEWRNAQPDSTLTTAIPPMAADTFHSLNYFDHEIYTQYKIACTKIFLNFWLVLALLLLLLWTDCCSSQENVSMWIVLKIKAAVLMICSTKLIKMIEKMFVNMKPNDFVVFIYICLSVNELSRNACSVMVVTVGSGRSYLSSNPV